MHPIEFAENPELAAVGVLAEIQSLLKPFTPPEDFLYLENGDGYCVLTALGWKRVQRVLELAETAYKPVYFAHSGDAGETDARGTLFTAQCALGVVVPALHGIIGMNHAGIAGDSIV